MKSFASLLQSEKIYLFSWLCFVLVMNLVEYIKEQNSLPESAENRGIDGVSNADKQLAVYPPANYCRYCDKQCNSSTKFAEHCRSKDHIFKVTADWDHGWKFRIPPAGDQFELCLE